MDITAMSVMHKAKVNWLCLFYDATVVAIPGVSLMIHVLYNKTTTANQDPTRYTDNLVHLISA